MSKKVTFECPTCGDKTHIGFAEKKLDTADLVLITKYHQESNGNGNVSTDDIDTIIGIAKSFYKKHSKTNWEESKIDWENSIINHYNKKRPNNWNPIT